MLNLSDIHLKRNDVTLFDGLDLSVHAGQRVAIVGRNGAGKSTLFDLILGRVQSDAGDVTRPKEWRVAHMAQEVAATSRAAIDYVIDGHAELRRAEAALAEAQRGDDDMAIANAHARLEDLDAYEAHARAGAILHGLGFDGAEVQRPFAEFSGGWRIRLNLARALMTPSDLLLLDEPTNHLDLEATVWLEQWLKRFPGTLLLIAHDRAFLDNVAQITVHLHGGRAASYRGNYSAFERQRAEDLANQQATFEKQQREVAHIRSFVDRFRAKASKASQVQSRLKALEKMEAVAPIHADSPYRLSFPDPEKMSTPLLTLRDVSVGYDGRAVVSHIRETLLPGARIGVLGENGAGKSTLLKCLVRELEPLTGEVVRGQHAEVGYFAQHQLETLDARATALAEVQAANPERREQWCRDTLGRWGFSSDKIGRPIATLSGGEKARLVLCLIATHRPALLILDEPTNHLDLDMRDALALALQAYAGALIIVAHDRSLLSRTVDEIWVVEDGTVSRRNSDVDAYAAAHDRSAPAAGGMPAPANGTADSRRNQRRAAAEQRRKAQPLKREIDSLERNIETLGARLAKVEAKLADPETYNGLPADELDALMREAATVRSRREAAEAQWLEKSERLETLLASGD